MSHPTIFDRTVALSYGDIDVTLVEARTVVDRAPDQSRIALGLLVGANQLRLFAADDRLYFGNDRHGHPVVYKAVGWDAEACALIIERLDHPSPRAGEAAAAAAAGDTPGLESPAATNNSGAS